MATFSAAAAAGPWQIRDGCLMVRDKVVLSRVAPNTTLTPLKDGAAFCWSWRILRGPLFLTSGATSRSSSSCHVFNIGILRGYRFVSLFRFKLWWMIPYFGDAASKVPVDTQMLLLEAREASAPASGFNGTILAGDEDADEFFYVLFLPVLDGPFRTSLQGTDVDMLQFCAESGDPNVQTSEFSEAVMINTDTNPFDLIKKSVRILEKHNGTFGCIEHKKLPAQVDLFGWSTWDAFYNAVDRIGIEEGLKSLMKIWNLNKTTGVLGIFNCQRGGIWPPTRGAPYDPPTESEPFIISGTVSPRDVEFLGEVAGQDWLGDSAVYSYTTGVLSTMPKEGSLEVTLAFLGFEVHTVSPIRAFDEKHQFAPLGLLDMYNSGGAVEAMNSSLDSSGRKIEIRARGCGQFGAYSNSKPRSCSVDGKGEDIGYNAENGMLTITLPRECTLRTIAFVY